MDLVYLFPEKQFKEKHLNYSIDCNTKIFGQVKANVPL